MIGVKTTITFTHGTQFPLNNTLQLLKVA